MIWSITRFGIGVFLIWYLPAIKAAITGGAGSRVGAILAGMFVALPVTILASVGALLGAMAARSQPNAHTWPPIVGGLVCGIVAWIVARTPKDPSRAFQIASGLWSGIPVLARIVLVGAIIAFVVFKFAVVSQFEI